MRIAVFSTHSYDREFFDPAFAGAEHELVYFAPRLTPETVPLAAGFEGVCVFVGVDVAVRVGEGVIERTGDGWEEGEIVFVIDGVETGVLKSTLPGPGEACSRQSPAIFVSMLAGKRSRECPEPASFTEGLKAKMELPQETTSTKESVPSRSKTSSPVLLR